MGWLCLAQLGRSGRRSQIWSAWSDLVGVVRSGRRGHQITCKAGSASFICLTLLGLLFSSSVLLNEAIIADSGLAHDIGKHFTRPLLRQSI